MKAAPLPLEEYKAAGRAALEQHLELFARVEKAADIEPGSLVGDTLRMISEMPDDEIPAWIESGWQIENDKGWESRVGKAVSIARRPGAVAKR